MRRLVSKHEALVEDPLHRAAGEADERLVQHAAIEPEIDGHDGRRRQASRAIEEIAKRRRLAFEQLGKREPRDRRDDAGRGPPLVTGFDGRHLTTPVAVVAHDNLRERTSADRSSVALDVLTRGLRVHQVERFGRKGDGGGLGVVPEHLREHPREGGRRGLIRRLIERRERQRGPQHLTNARRLAVSHEPALDRLSRRRRFHGRPRPELSARVLQWRRHPQRGQTIPPRKRLPLEHPGDEMERCRQRRTCEARAPQGAIDHRHRELRIEAHVVQRADVAQEREGLGIAPEQNVLSVVHELARLAVGKRGRASPEASTRFEHEHARAAPGEAGGGAQAGKAGADDDDVEAGQVHSHCLSAMSACRGRGTRARAVNTSCPLRSMRVSVSEYTARMISAATSRLRSSGGSASFARL